MKRMMSLVLALAVLLGLCVPFGGMAAEKPLVISYDSSANVLKTKVNATASGEIHYTLTDTLNKVIVANTTVGGAVAGQEYTWTVPYDDTGLTAAKPTKRMRAAFEMDGKTYTFDLFFTLEKKDGVVSLLVEKATWYPNNTACSFGPQFREVRPSLTEKWYMFTPIDLTQQGRQEFEYAAGNMYILGKVYVDVSGDRVVVTYHNYYADQGGNTETKSEFFTFYPDLAAVTNVDDESLYQGGFTFGAPLSIQNDLGGDTNVLLFVRNRVNYRDYVTNAKKLTRFWINHPDRVAVRNQMLALMEK